MESSSLFSDDFESVPVSWRAQGSSWLFCTHQFRTVLCLFPGAFQDTLSVSRVFCGWAVALGSGKCLLASLARGGESAQQKVQSQGKRWDTSPNFGVAHGKLCEGSATGPGHSLYLL